MGLTWRERTPPPGAAAPLSVSHQLVHLLPRLPLRPLPRSRLVTAFVAAPPRSWAEMARLVHPLAAAGRLNLARGAHSSTTASGDSHPSKRARRQPPVHNVAFRRPAPGRWRKRQASGHPPPTGAHLGGAAASVRATGRLAPLHLRDSLQQPSPTLVSRVLLEPAGGGADSRLAAEAESQHLGLRVGGVSAHRALPRLAAA